jgi:hypothetical protein
MSTGHENPAGSLDNIPRFLICQKIQEKHWIQQYSKSASPCFTQHTLWKFSQYLRSTFQINYDAEFLPRKVSSTASISNGKYQQRRCILATDILHLQHEQLRCSVFMLNVSLVAILSKTGMCWQFLVTVHLIKVQDNLSRWSHMFHMDKHTTGC